jgi:hypothetical protein
LLRETLVTRHSPFVHIPYALTVRLFGAAVRVSICGISDICTYKNDSAFCDLFFSGELSSDGPSQTKECKELLSNPI